MTGYGRGEAEEGGLRVQAEVRTVNHRYLDVSVRLPDAFLFLEEPVRRQVSARLSRGRVGVHLAFEDTRERAQSVRINMPLLNAYAEAAEAVRQRFFPDREPDLRWLLTVPDLFGAPSRDGDADVWAAATERAVAGALDEAVAMRVREGQALREQMLAGTARLEAIVAEIAERAPMQVHGIRERLERRLAELLSQGAGIDEQRLAMEVALLADKADVEEELTRLGSHLGQMRDILDRSDPPVGRRLDFLAQEIHRELNTIGAKSADRIISDRIVEAKVELERLREQAQNIE